MCPSNEFNNESQIYQLNRIIQISLIVPNISVKSKEASFDGLAQDCSNSSANALELLQSCAKLHFQSSNLNNLNFYL